MSDKKRGETDNKDGGAEAEAEIEREREGQTNPPKSALASK